MMKQRTLVPVIAVIVTIVGLVRATLAQESIYLPMVASNSTTQATPTTTSETTATPVATTLRTFTTGVAQNIYAGEVTIECPNSRINRPGNYGELTDDDGNVWMVPAPVAGGFTNVDVYNDCTGTGANDYAAELTTQVIDENGSEITAYLFADNYYEFYVNGTYAGRDAVPFIPFDSHAARFQAEYPVTYAVLLVDWEGYNGIGLEDSPNGISIGDGGFIATFSDGTATNADWVCKPFYIAPLDNNSCVVIDSNGNADSSACNSTNETVSCVANDPENSCMAYLEELPENWMAGDYDDSGWLAATTYTADDVTGAEAFRDYEETLFAGADFIWSSNLALDNAVVCRATMEDPNATATPESTSTSASTSTPTPTATFGAENTATPTPTPTSTTTSSITSCDTPGTVSQSTDANIEQMRQAILAFRNSLSASLLEEASTCLDNERFYLWHNTPNDRDDRGGIQYGDLTDPQIGLFEDLLKLFLSDTGYQKVEEVVYLAEGFLNGINSAPWSTDYYSIDMFGDPENSGSWGFQLDGHHMAINFLVHGDHVSIVPAFIGAEPVFGTHNGTDFDVFSAERDLAFTLYNNLTADENSAATSTGDDSAMVVGPADQPGDSDPYRGDYDYSGFEVGLKYSDMSAATQANLMALMQAYVYNLETPFADLWWVDIMSAIDDTYFVWIDETDELTNLSIYYYRIYNPHLWIEYNVEDSVGGNIEAGNHAHSITRVPSTSNGGDYGIFASVINQNGPRTLLEHYAVADHHLLSGYHLDYQLANSHDHHTQDWLDNILSRFINLF